MLAAVRSTVVIVSAGEGIHFGHPDPEVLEGAADDTNTRRIAVMGCAGKTMPFHHLGTSPLALR